jgi:creatinine amidohydrolase
LSDESLAGIRVADVAWPEVEERLRYGASAVLPVGAGAKQHGLHLPMGTDKRQAEWLTARLVAARDVVVWPKLAYGYYPAFVDYPGSISLARHTFVAVVLDIVQGIARAGASRIVILNTGISTIEPLAEAAVSAPAGVPVRLLNVYAGPRWSRVVAEIEEQAWGGHADELETSVMLAIAPDQVDMRRAEPAVHRVERGAFNRHDPDASNYPPPGVGGDPSLATRDKGELLLQAMLADVLEAVDAGAQ